jgi:hypothetical protein
VVLLYDGRDFHTFSVLYTRVCHLNFFFHHLLLSQNSIMSAIPNLPESVPRDSNPDAALHHLLKSNEVSTHIEHAEVKEQTHINGAHTNGENLVKAETPFLLHDSPIENQRPIRVIVIGAGYSGVYCAIRIPERLRNCELVVYEKNAGVGGTWYAP